MSEKYKYKIYIDSSKRSDKSVALFDEDNKVISKLEGDIDIIEAIKSLLNKNNIKVSEVFFDFFEGPADSFTGLKVGSVISNVLNWANSQNSKPKYPTYGREPNISQRRK